MQTYDVINIWPQRAEERVRGRYRGGRGVGISSAAERQVGTEGTAEEEAQGEEEEEEEWKDKDVVYPKFSQY